MENLKPELDATQIIPYCNVCNKVVKNTAAKYHYISKKHLKLAKQKEIIDKYNLTDVEKFILFN
jgi:hypothetical protein